MDIIAAIRQIERKITQELTGGCMVREKEAVEKNDFHTLLSSPPVRAKRPFEWNDSAGSEALPRRPAPAVLPLSDKMQGNYSDSLSQRERELRNQWSFAAFFH